MRRSCKNRAVVSAIGMTLLATPSHAQDDWRFQVTPYLWGTSLDGDIDPGQGLPTISIDRSQSDVIDAMEAALFVTGTARKGRFVALGDLSYASLSEKDDVKIPAFGPDFKLPIKTEVKLAAATLVAGYTTVDTAELTMDLMAGARFWHADVSTKATDPVPGLPDKLSGDDSWTDPVLAARARYRIAEDWTVIAYGDYGGFGVNSDETWQVAATLNYRVNDTIFLSGGYRVLALDYTKDGVTLDTRLGGPLIGATFRF